MRRLEPGDEAPALNLENQDGSATSLDTWAGRRVLLYFYPKDATPGCTTEATQFGQLLDRFTEKGVTVVGVSPDPADSHRRFRASVGIQFDLLSDGDHSVMESYGAWGEKSSYGKTVVGAIRSTVLIGADGRVEKAWYNVKADGHAERVLKEL